MQLTKKLLAVIFVLFESMVMKAQTTEVLRAERLFSDNQYEEALALSDQLLSGRSISKKEKISLYELSIRSALELGQLDQVDPRFKKLLRTDPFYVPVKETVEERYMNFFKKYQVLPKLSIGVNMWFVKPRIKVVNSYQVFDELDYANSEYTTTMTNCFSGHLDYFPLKRHRLSLVVANPSYNFSRMIRATNNDNLDLNYLVDSLQYEEVGKCLLTGITYGFYPVRTPRWGIGISAGALRYKLNSANGNAKVQYQLGTSEWEKVASPVRDRQQQEERNLSYIYSNLGLDAYLNSRKIGINAGLSYNRALDIFNVQEKRYEDDLLVYSYYYADDDLFIDLLQFHVGVSYNISYRVK